MRFSDPCALNAKSGISNRTPVSHAYLRSDILNTLAAAALALRHSNQTADYDTGYRNALATVATALGFEYGE